MSKRVVSEPSDRRLKYLLDMAEECHVVAGGYRLRFARNNTTLLLVVGAIDANPALRFTVTTSETGACWVDVGTPHEHPPPLPRPNSAPRSGAIPIVA